MVRSFLVAIGLLGALLVGCGGVAESPPTSAVPPNVPTAIVGGIDPISVQPGIASTTSQSETNSPVSSATQSSQPSVDDDRVEGLVTEWETDLAPIGRVSECVESALGLDRPLWPEDFELQANQPAIVSCVQAEVGNE